MIIISRKYRAHPATGGSYETTEFKVFADDDVRGVQEYLDQCESGIFDFQKL